MTRENVRLRLPAFEIDIQAVDELTLKEIYVEDERKADRFEHYDADISVNIWRRLE